VASLLGDSSLGPFLGLPYGILTKALVASLLDDSSIGFFLGLPFSLFNSTELSILDLLFQAPSFEFFIGGASSSTPTFKTHHIWMMPLPVSGTPIL
jgi:hypothetical protein